MLLRLAVCTAFTFAAALPAQDTRVSRGRAPEDTPAAPGGAAGSRTVVQELETLLAAARRSDAVPFWDWLPGSYQGDLEGLVRDLGTRVDAKVYERAMALVARIARVGIDKEQFVFGNPAFVAAMARMPEDPKTVRACYGAAMKLLQALATSDLESTTALQRFSGRSFAAKAGKPMLQGLFAIARAQGHEVMDKLAGMRFAMLQQEGDRAEVETRAPGERPKVETFVRVEGRWLPQQLVRDWPLKMNAARRRIAALPEGGDPRLMAQVRLVLGTIDGVVRKFEEAETQAEFDAAWQQVQELENQRGRRER